MKQSSFIDRILQLQSHDAAVPAQVPLPPVGRSPKPAFQSNLGGFTAAKPLPRQAPFDSRSQPASHSKRPSLQPTPCKCGSQTQWRPRTRVASAVPWQCLACSPPQSAALPIERITVSDADIRDAEEQFRQDTGIVTFSQALVPWCPHCGSSVGAESPAGCHCFCCKKWIPDWPGKPRDEIKPVVIGRSWPPEVDPRIIAGNVMGIRKPQELSNE